MYLSVVPPPLIPSIWPKAAPFIFDALMNGGHQYYDMGHIRAFIDEGKMTLWVLIGGEGGIVGAGVTEIVQYPKRRVASVVLFGASPGLRDTWLPTLENVEQWAKEMGCDDVRVMGRSGWKFYLRDYRMASMVLVKELQNDAKLDFAS